MNRPLNATEQRVVQVIRAWPKTRMTSQLLIRRTGLSRTQVLRALRTLQASELLCCHYITQNERVYYLPGE